MSRRRMLLFGGLLAGAVVTIVLIQRLNRHLTEDPLAATVAAIEQRGGKVRRDDNTRERRVVSVQWNRSHVTDADVQLLEAFPDLEELHLVGTSVTDEGLKHLRSLHRLRILNLRNTQITDTGLAELKNHTALEELLLLDTKVTDAGLDSLTHLRGLRVLEVPRRCFTPRGYRVFRDLGFVGDFPGLLDADGKPAARLQEIHTLAFPLLGAPREHIADWLAEIPKLRVVQVDKDLVTDDLLRELSRLGKLHMLRVNFWDEFDKRAFPLLTRSERERFDAERPDRDEDITRFEFYRCNVSDASLDVLLTLRKLDYLDLSNTAVTSSGLIRLAALPNLTQVIADRVRLNATDLQPFKGHKGLTLRIDFDLSDAGLKAYREGGVLHLLRSAADQDRNDWALDLAGSPLTDAGLDELKDFHDFSSLRLSETNVTDAGLARLSGHPQLKRLFLNDTQITDVGLKHLSGLRELEQLDLHNAAVTDTGLRHLAGLPKLVKLNLQGTQVTGIGMKHLAGIPKLEDLSMRSTQVTDTELKELPALTALRRLDLHDTEVTDAGLVELKKLTKPKKLDLWDTRVTDAGIDDLRAALPDCNIQGRAKRNPR